MSLDTTVPRSRRALLGAALGAAAATVASALGRPASVVATDGQPLIVGGSNTTDSTTYLDQGVAMAHTFAVNAGGAGDAVYGFASSTIGILGEGGQAGVKGNSGIAGVLGTSLTGVGVRGTNEVANYAAVEGQGPIGVAGWGGVTPSQLTSQAGTGVYGSGTTTGVCGEATTGTGVQGYSGAYGTEPAAPVKTGVYGSATEDATARGVCGQTTVGTGVRGESTTAPASMQPDTTGTALQVVGKARFDRARTGTILKGHSSYKKTLAGVTSASQVFAVLRTYRSGTYVAAVVCGSGYFTVYLNKALTADTNVSYFVVN